MSDWTPELKEKAVKLYLAEGPTAETSSKIINDLAETLEMSPNGVRQVLIQAKVYVKKDPSAEPAGKAKSSGTAAKADGTKRVSKEDQIAELRTAIEARNAPVDEDILSKLTGKAAAYFTAVLAA